MRHHIMIKITQQNMKWDSQRYFSSSSLAHSSTPYAWEKFHSCASKNRSTVAKISSPLQKNKKRIRNYFDETIEIKYSVTQSSQEDLLHENPFMLSNVCILFLANSRRRKEVCVIPIKLCSQWQRISNRRKRIFFHSFNLGHINWVFGYF